MDANKYKKTDLIDETDELHARLVGLLRNTPDSAGKFNALLDCSMDTKTLKLKWIKLRKLVKQSALTYDFKAMTSRKAVVAEKLKRGEYKESGDPGPYETLSHSKAYETAAGTTEYRLAIQHRAVVESDLEEIDGYYSLIDDYLRTLQMKLSQLKNKQ